MDTKGEVEEMTYPHICLLVDNVAELYIIVIRLIAESVRHPVAGEWTQKGRWRR